MGLHSLLFCKIHIYIYIYIYISISFVVLYEERNPLLYVYEECTLLIQL